MLDTQHRSSGPDRCVAEAKYVPTVNNMVFFIGCEGKNGSKVSGERGAAWERTSVSGRFLRPRRKIKKGLESDRTDTSERFLPRLANTNSDAVYQA